MPSDSANVDSALVALLSSDATLVAALPGGVYFDVGPHGATRFVILSQLAHEDEHMAGGTAWERYLYLVKAVVQSSVPTAAASAALRIHTLMEDQPLAVAGYGLMRMHRMERVRYSEVDEEDADTRWQHQGGHYEVTVSPS